MKNRNLILLTTLWTGLTSGLPLALTSSTFQAWLTSIGTDVHLIGASSLLALPYLLKFLWAPLLDRYQLPFLRRRTGWIASTQLIIAALLILISFMHPETHLNGVAIFIFLLAAASATQDIAIDAYRTELIPPSDRGLGSAYYTTGYRIAMLFSGGLALIMADHLGFPWMLRIMAITMLLMSLITRTIPEHLVKNTDRDSTYALLKEAVSNFLEQPHAYTLLSFIFLYKFGEALGSSLPMYFLMHDLHFNLTEIGSVYKSAVLIATLIGTFIGGTLYKKIGVRRALLMFGFAQAAGWLPYAYLAFSGKSMAGMVIAVGTEAFTAGMATSAFVALLMTLCDTRYTATQFALLSAIASIARVTTGPLAANIALHIGWGPFFIFACGISLPALWLLRQKSVISHRF